MGMGGGGGGGFNPFGGGFGGGGQQYTFHFEGGFPGGGGGFPGGGFGFNFWLQPPVKLFFLVNFHNGSQTTDRKVETEQLKNTKGKSY